MGSMKKRYILFSAVTFILFLFLMEGGTRAFFWVKNKIEVRERNFSQYLGWESVANVSKKHSMKGYGEIIFSTQEYGFRRFGDTKTNKTKVFVIGDSFTFAHSVSDGNTYYRYLEKHNDNVEVFAYGGSGYGSLQEFMILDQYFDEISPDIVLWQFCSNDFINNSHELESISFANNNQMTRPYYRNGSIVWLFPKQYGGWLDKLIQSSYLLRLFNIRLNTLAAEKKESIERKLSPDHPLFRKSAKTTSEIMGFARERIGDIPMLAFLVDASTWMESTIRDICEAHSIDFIRGIPEAVAEAKKSGTIVDGSPYNTHWNGAGHAIAGERILHHLNDKGHLHKRDRSIPESQAAYADVLKKYRPAWDHIIPFEKLDLLRLTPRNSSGFGPIEGPNPARHMPRKVRWMVSPRASVKVGAEVESDKGCYLHIRVLSHAVPQSFKVLLNGNTVLEESIDNKWYELKSRHLMVQDGKNALEFQADNFRRYPNSDMDLYVLFDLLELRKE